MAIDSINGAQQVVNIPQEEIKQEEKVTQPQSSGNTKDILATLGVLASLSVAAVAIIKNRNAAKALEKAEKEVKNLKEVQDAAKKAAEEAQNKIKTLEEKLEAAVNKTAEDVTKTGEKAETEPTKLDIDIDGKKSVKEFFSEKWSKVKSFFTPKRKVKIKTPKKPKIGKLPTFELPTSLVKPKKKAKATATASTVGESKTSLKEKASAFFGKIKAFFTPKVKEAPKTEPKVESKVDPKEKEPVAITEKGKKVLEKLKELFPPKEKEAPTVEPKIEPKSEPKTETKEKAESFWSKIKTFFTPKAKEAPKAETKSEPKAKTEEKTKSFWSKVKTFFSPKPKETPKTETDIEPIIIELTEKEPLVLTEEGKQIVEKRRAQLNGKKPDYQALANSLVKEPKTEAERYAIQRMYYDTMAETVPNRTFNDITYLLKPAAEMQEKDILSEYNALKNIAAGKTIQSPAAKRFLELQGELYNHRGYEFINGNPVKSQIKKPNAVQDGLKYLNEEEAAAKKAIEESNARNAEWVKEQNAIREAEYEKMFLNAEAEHNAAKEAKAVQDGLKYLDEEEAAAKKAIQESNARNAEWVKEQNAIREAEYEKMFLNAEAEHNAAKEAKAVQDGLKYLDEEEAVAKKAIEESNARNAEWIKEQNAIREAEYEKMFLNAEAEHNTSGVNNLPESFNQEQVNWLKAHKYIPGEDVTKFPKLYPNKKGDKIITPEIPMDLFTPKQIKFFLANGFTQKGNMLIAPVSESLPKSAKQAKKLINKLYEELKIRRLNRINSRIGMSNEAVLYNPVVVPHNMKYNYRKYKSMANERTTDAAWEPDMTREEFMKNIEQYINEEVARNTTHHSSKPHKPSFIDKLKSFLGL